MITLYHHPLCPSSRSIRLACAESGITINPTEVKPWALTRDFLNINPAGTLPVLDAGGKTVCGAYPISEYLSETANRDGYGGTKPVSLWPQSPLERAEARRVADWFLRKFDAEVSQHLLDEKFYKPMAKRRLSPDISIIKMARSNLRYHLTYVSFLSDQRKWLGGDHLSFADFAAAAALSSIDYLAEVSWADFPEAKTWYARLKSRPSFRSLLSDRIPGFAPPSHYDDLDF